MYAIRQIIDDPQDVIPVPPEMRHRPTEVIFIAIEAHDTLNNQATTPIQISSDPIARFCGSGSGGTTSRLLAERQAERVLEK